MDLSAFFALGAVAIAVHLFFPKLQADQAVLFLCAALLAMDCGSILVAPYHKLPLLAAGAASGTVFMYLYSRLKRQAFLTAAVRLALTYLAVYLVLLPVWDAIAERRQTSGPERADAPNVLIIIVDALRADHLSAYGYSRRTSPNFDSLATRGALFTSAVAPSSWTLPSHASLLTGRLESEHQAGDTKAFLDDRFPIMSSTFEQMGYRTAAFSGNSYVFSRRAGFGRGFMHFEDGSLVEKLLQTNLGRHLLNQLGLWRMADISLGRQTAQVISRNAFRWITRSHKPFFVVINYFDVHAPYTPSMEYMRRFSSREPLRDQAFWPLDVQLKPQQLQDQIDAYDACILYTDANISQLLNDLQQSGYMDNTVVVITSDHGEAFNEQGFVFHGQSLYWNLIHVPLLIYAPGRVSPSYIQTPVSLLSVPSTLLSLVHGSAKDYPWPSLQRLWDPDPKESEPVRWPVPISELAWISESSRFPSHYGPMKSIVTTSWHYIEGGKLGAELYDCCGLETIDKNRLPTPQGQEMQTRFRAIENATAPFALDAEGQELESVAADKMSGTGQAPQKRDPNHMNEALRALGYLH